MWPANPGEVIAKQATELKPSRKRKRWFAADEEQDEQGGFGGGAPVAALVALVPAATALDPDRLETPNTPDLLPGFSAPHDAIQSIHEATQAEWHSLSRRRLVETALDVLETK